MSVHGEYGRYLSNLIDVLDTREDVADADVSAPRRATVASAGDLSKAAELALDALARPDLVRPIASDERTSELAGGLAAIARLILGRPAEA